MSHAWMPPKLPCCHIHGLIEVPGVWEVALASQAWISLLTERLQVLQDGAPLGSFIAVYENQLPFLVGTLVEGFSLLSPEV